MVVVKFRTHLMSIILLQLVCGSPRAFASALKITRASKSATESSPCRQQVLRKPRANIDGISCHGGAQISTASSPGPATFGAIYAASFLFVFSNALVAFSPAPALMEKLGTARATRVLSMLASASAFLQIVFSPVVGTFLDSFGRKPVLVACFVSIFIAYGSVSLRSTIPWISLAKVMSTFCVGIFFLTTQAILSDITVSQPEKLSSCMGIQLSLTSLGFLCGSVGAGQLAGRGLKVPYSVSACVVGIALFLVSTLMAETLSLARESTEKVSRTVTKFPSPLASLRLLFWHKELRVVVILLLLSTMPTSMGEVFQIYAKAEWDLEAKTYAAFVALFGVIGILGNLVGSVLVRKIGIKSVIILSSASSVLVPIGATFFQFRGAVVGMILGFLSSAQTLTIGAALISQGARLGILQGELAGSRTSIVALLKVVAPIWYSTIYVQGKKLTGLNVLPFLFNIAIALVALALGVLCLSNEKTD